jgi:hypothetical protein
MQPARTQAFETYVSITIAWFFDGHSLEMSVFGAHILVQIFPKKTLCFDAKSRKQRVGNFLAS